MKQVGLIGYPVSHSLSPQMHNAAFEALGIEAQYVLWETSPETLEARIALLRSVHVLGANVTIPYKGQVLSLVDECDPLAARIGAVNTIVKRDGQLVGYNTDAPGFLRALAQCPGSPFSGQGKRVVILGTGGAARAAAVALMEHGAKEISLLGRTVLHLDELRQHLLSLATDARVKAVLLGSPEAGAFLRQADLVVNATPVGLKKDDTSLLIDVDLLPTTALVMDMIFNPPLTPLLRAAQARGCPVLNGLSMLLYQGILAFELWTGRDAPVKVMGKALGLL